MGILHCLSQFAIILLTYRSSALIIACKSGYASNTNDFLALIKFLARDVDLIDPFESAGTQESWINFRSAAEVFAWILQHSNSSYQVRTLEERVIFAIKMCKVAFQRNMAGLVKTILLGQKLDANLCHISDNKRSTLLHCAAWNLGETHLTATVQSERLEDQLGFLSDLIIGGLELHTLTLGGRTSILEVFSGLLYSASVHHTSPLYYMLCASTADAILPIKNWLEQLESYGVDLRMYGEEEKRVLECDSAEREFKLPRSRETIEDTFLGCVWYVSRSVHLLMSGSFGSLLRWSILLSNSLIWLNIQKALCLALGKRITLTMGTTALINFNIGLMIDLFIRLRSLPVGSQLHSS